MHTLAIHAELLHNHARAADNLARVALLIDFAQTRPSAENLRVTDLDEVDLVLRAERLDELEVLGLGVGLDQDAQVGVTLVKSLGALAKTTRKTVMNEGVLQDLL